jgi:SRSO17 transposase
MIRELKKIGFKFELVLADSLYGESNSNFVSVLDEFELNYVVAIRSNHGVWMPLDEKVRYNKWRRFNRLFSDGKTKVRYIREIVFGTRKSKCYWQITTDPINLPESSTWWVMTKVPGIKHKEVGNIFGLRTWVEYGLKQSKNELGWADFRLTEYPDIQKWWEIVCSTYLLVSLYSEHLNQSQRTTQRVFSEHPWWDKKKGWKNLLNNLRLIIQPFVYYNLIKPWLEVLPIPHLEGVFSQLTSLMNRFANRILTRPFVSGFLFSSG